MKEPDFILTRYLYSKTDVTHSFFLSLLEHKHNEALYWAYELYFSGFQNDIFEFVLRTYEEIYNNTNPDLEQFIKNEKILWDKNPNHHWRVGSIIYTLSKREYDLSDFVEIYFKIKCEKETKQSKKPLFIIHMCERDIEKYKSKDHMNLDLVLEFPIRKNVIDLFNSGEPENLTEIYSDIDNWLYYAAKSPIWEHRLSFYGALMNEDDVCIEFPSEEKREEFYEKWNYDLEEQSIEIQDAINGEDIVQLTIKEFASKYGVKIKMKKKVKSPEKLENTIIYHNRTNM